MSYYITISGHKDTQSNEESAAFEQEVADKAKEFVATLEGATAASMSASQGNHDLMPKA